MELEKDDLLIEYKTVDASFDHEFGCEKASSNEITSVKFWNPYRDVWEDSEILPDFLEQQLFNKAYEILEREME